MRLLDELFPSGMQNRFYCLEEKWDEIEEIRLRVNRPVFVKAKNKEYFVSRSGLLKTDAQDVVKMDEKDMDRIVHHICHASPYAYEEEIKRGYITVKGGHRVGLSGQAVLVENDVINTLKNISFINIRIAHQIKGAGKDLLRYIYENGKVQNTLIISPPGYGKTTLLRDLIRSISDGNCYAKGMNCSVIDERSELAGCYNGIPQLEVGIRTDVMDSCPKSIGMMMAIRSMAPQVMAVDELGTAEDIKALFAVIRSGCSILATIHGESAKDVAGKSFLKEVMDENVFSRYIIIKNQNRETQILDGKLEKCLK